MKHNFAKALLSLFVILSLLFGIASCAPADESGKTGGYESIELKLDGVDPITVPGFSGKEFYILNNNQPFFGDDEIVTKSYEKYYPLDALGRCTLTIACIGKDLMPTEERGDIASVKPSGWVQAKYDTAVISGGYLYNRSHLIGFQLTGENDNEENLITGTRFMNEAMIPFENQIADYIKETDNHVMYRVTPIFVGNDLVAAGVVMEAYSVEDAGDGISFNVFLYNNQPGITIDYLTGKSWLSGEAPDNSESDSSDENDRNNGNNAEGQTYILNTSSKLIHESTCGNAAKISDKNREEYTGDINSLIEDGYKEAGCCLGK